MRSTVARLVALALAVTACSAAAEVPTTTITSITSTSTTSTTSTTTSTTPPDLDTSVINGLPVDDAGLLNRRVLAVKIDNHPRANPQSGIEKADMVIELMVEGITRFITIWHESDSDYLGPTRSGRPTDPTLLMAFNEPTIFISGAQPWVQNLIRGKDIHLLGESSNGAFRVSGRSAPHNLYVNTIALRETADARNHPDMAPDGPIWEFGPMPESADNASKVTIDFSGNTVSWTWDAATGLWLRTAYGGDGEYLDEDGARMRVGVPVLVALYTDQYTASPPGSQSGSNLPASKTTGSGEAFVFANGKVVEGTWERASESEWFTLIDDTGTPILVPPGKSWVSLVPSHRGLSIEG